MAIVSCCSSILWRGSSTFSALFPLNSIARHTLNRCRKNIRDSTLNCTRYYLFEIRLRGIFLIRSRIVAPTKSLFILHYSLSLFPFHLLRICDLFFLYLSAWILIVRLIIKPQFCRPVLLLLLLLVSIAVLLFSNASMHATNRPFIRFIYKLGTLGRVFIYRFRSFLEHITRSIEVAERTNERAGCLQIPSLLRMLFAHIPMRSLLTIQSWSSRSVSVDTGIYFHRRRERFIYHRPAH